MDISSVSNSSNLASSTDTSAIDSTDLTADDTTGSQDSTGVGDSSGSTATAGAAGDFKSFMLKALGGTTKTQMSEEELFAELIGKRLQDKDQSAADFYTAEKAKLAVSMARPGDGHVSYENVGIAALQATVAAGKLDDATAKQVNGEAFAAAQLDSNTDALYDDRGSDSDQTVAVASFDEAMAKVDAMLGKISSGEITVNARELTQVSTSAGGAAAGDAAGGSAAGAAMTGQQSLDGSGGFLWKPESDRDGNLVVLLPSDLNGLIDKVEIYSSLPPTAESLMGTGNFTSIGNGDRSHFRFDKPGAEYGDNVNVVVTKSDGEQVTWTVPNGADRTD